MAKVSYVGLTYYQSMPEIGIICIPSGEFQMEGKISLIPSRNESVHAS